MSGSDPSSSAPAQPAALEVTERVRRLVERETIGHSPDERVCVRVRGDGTLTGVSLSRDVSDRYDDAALAELVTRTIRGAQQRARAAYDRAVGELLSRPPVDGRGTERSA